MLKPTTSARVTWDRVATRATKDTAAIKSVPPKRGGR